MKDGKAIRRDTTPLRVSLFKDAETPMKLLQWLATAEIRTIHGDLKIGTRVEREKSHLRVLFQDIIIAGQAKELLQIQEIENQSNIKKPAIKEMWK